MTRRPDRPARRGRCYRIRQETLTRARRPGKSPSGEPGPAGVVSPLTPGPGRAAIDQDQLPEPLPLAMVTGMIAGYCVMVELVESNPLEVQATV